jgi:ferredoxin
MTDRTRTTLDRTICDRVKHAPGFFSLDDWSLTSLIGHGTVPAADRDAVLQALMDCPAHTIMELGERRADHAAPPSGSVPPENAATPRLKADENEAVWGSTR